MVKWYILFSERILKFFKSWHPKKQLIFFIFFFLLIILGLVVFFLHKIFTLIVLILILSVIQFFCMNRDFNPGHVFFVCLILTRLEGRILGVFFLLLAGFLPHILADFDEDIVVIYPIQILALLIFPFFPNLKIINYLVPLITYIVIFILAHEIDDPLPEQVRDVIIPIGLTLVYLTVYTQIYSFLEFLL